jgi:protein TonB
MFEQTFVNVQAQTRKPWSLLSSLCLQAILVTAALVAPLFQLARLEVPPIVVPFRFVQRIDLIATPDRKPALQSSVQRRSVVFSPPRRLEASVTRPVTLVDDAPDMALASAPNGTQGAGFSSPLSGLQIAPPQRPEEVRVKPTPTTGTAHTAGPVTVGGDVQAALLIYSPHPAYPPLARATRTQGSVRLRAIIARDGSIANLQLISGPPLLVKAAMDAVTQWRYRATLLNGMPVEVLTEITVNFTLSQ